MRSGMVFIQRGKSEFSDNYAHARARGRIRILIVIPLTFRQACNFVAKLHRHNKPPRGHKFSIGLMDETELVGVAMASRPVARVFDDGLTLEVVRTCTDGTANANSMLYGAIWRAAKAMGYRRCVTYTQHDETGASLRAVGWVREREIAPRGSWSDSTADERLKAMRDPIGNGGVARVLWSITSSALPELEVHNAIRTLCREPVRAAL